MKLSKIKKPYFSHPTTLFGTDVERFVIGEIKEVFGDCICPNLDKDLYKLGNDMEDYLQLIKNEADAVVCVENNFRGVGLGVFKEVKYALSINVPVYVYRNHKFIKVINVKEKKEGEYFDLGKLITQK
jgi:hypothetical protein